MKRTRCTVGIYADASGFEARVSWRGQLRTKRFPRGTPRREMEDWRLDTRRALEDADPQGPPQSFREMARVYLHSHAHLALASRGDRRRDVQGWIDVFGDVPVTLITVEECQQKLDEWAQEGYAGSTLNHRLDALVAVLPRLAGHLTRWDNRGDRPILAPPRTRMAAVLGTLRPNLTTTRLWWLYWTGMRPSQLGRMTLEAADFDAGLVTVPGGKGGVSYVVPLPPAAVAQLQSLTTAETFAPMSRGSANRVLLRACRKAKVPTFSLYAFRRSFGSTLRASGVDLADVQAMMGHKRISTTARYAPVVSHKLVRAVSALDVVTARGTPTGPIPLGD